MTPEETKVVRDILTRLAGKPLKWESVQKITTKAVQLDPQCPKGLEVPDISSVKMEYVKQLKEAASPIPKGKHFYPLGSFSEGSFEFWFNYFWAELTKTADKEKVYAQIPKDKDGNLIPPILMETNVKKKLLEMMLKIGFEEFTIGEKLDPEVLFAEAKKSKGTVQTEGVRVLFRGDARKPEEIERHGGTLPRSRVFGQKNALGMNELWHPWRPLRAGNKVYYRKGFNADNCLNTAVSVTYELPVATKFPLLNEMKPTEVGTAIVELETPVKVGGSSVSDRIKFFSNQNGVKLKASKTTIYAVKMTGGWNTQGRQLRDLAGTFPEFAVDQIPFTYHLAVLYVIRIHFGEDMNDGHLIVVTDWKFIQPKHLLDKLLLLPKHTASLEKYLKDFCAPGKGMLLPNGFGGVPYRTDQTPAGFGIKKVKQIDVGDIHKRYF